MGVRTVTLCIPPPLVDSTAFIDGCLSRAVRRLGAVLALGWQAAKSAAVTERGHGASVTAAVGVLHSSSIVLNVCSLLWQSDAGNWESRLPVRCVRAVLAVSSRQ